MKKTNSISEPSGNESPDKSTSKISQNSVSSLQLKVNNTKVSHKRTLPVVKEVINKKLLKNGMLKNNNCIENNKTKLVNKKQQRLTKFSSPKLSITKRVCQMQKCIIELKTTNKDLKIENEYLRKAALRSMTNFICAKKLQEELQQTELKNSDLVVQLNQKNEIIEKYQLLLKEISSNVNILMRELQNDNKSDGLMRKKLKQLSQIQQKSEHIAINPKCLNSYVYKQPLRMVQKMPENTFSSSSDTLIDADLSFETSTRSNSEEPRNVDYLFKPIKQTQYKIPSIMSSFDGSLSMENNCMSNQDDDENNDDDNSITLSLDEMSITTIPTSEIQNSLNESTHISQNEDFQHGLNELDQKIFKAKMLLESIKIK